MFRSLLRTLPALSGNVKLVCRITPDEDIKNSVKKTDEVVCHVKSAALYPVSDNINQYGVKVNLLSSTYDYDLKDFYSINRDIFYSSQYKYNKSEIEKLDRYTATNERDKDFEFGCRRALYSVTGTQFEFFAPIYIENINDIPDEFVISLQIDNGIYKVDNKKIHIKIKDIIYKKSKETEKTEALEPSSTKTSELLQYNVNLLYDYLYRYVISYNQDGMFSEVIKFNYNEQDSNLNVSNAVYWGVDLERGGFTKAIDSTVNSLYYTHLTINSFDDIVTNGFKRHKMAMKQIIPLCFSFNIEDIVTAGELKRINLSKVQFSGKYEFLGQDIKNWNKTGELYDFSINYTDYFIPSDEVDRATCRYKYKKNHTSNIMDQPFPALREKTFWKYRFMNKISPNTTRWTAFSSEKYITSDTVNFPYIINNNAAFSIANSSSIKYGLFTDGSNSQFFSPCNITAISNDGVFYDSNKIAELGDTYYKKLSLAVQMYNFVLPTNAEVYTKDENSDNIKLYNYDYMRGFAPNNTLSSFNNYIDAIIKNKYAFNDVLYLTDSFYNKKINGNVSVVDFISNPENVVSVQDIVSGSNVFKDVFSYEDLSFYCSSDNSIFDEKSDMYSYRWSTAAFNTVYHNGMLFDLSSLYETDGFVKLTDSEFAASILDESSKPSTTALSVASKNNIINYINNRNIENFKKTRYITKFGVFVLPVMSVILENSNDVGASNIYSVSTVYKYTDEDVVNKKTSSVLTYTNVLTRDASSLYNTNKISLDYYNAIIEDSSLYIKSKVTLSDIMSDSNNIAYWNNSSTGLVSYVMSDNFTYSKKYSNLYINEDELLTLVKDAPTAVNSSCDSDNQFNLLLPERADNVYYAYNEICDALDLISDNANTDSSIAKSAMLSIINDIQSEGIKEHTVYTYGLVSVSDIYSITDGSSNVLAYSFTDEESDNDGMSALKTVSKTSYTVCTSNGDSVAYYDIKYNSLYKETDGLTHIVSVFIDGAHTKSELINTGMYNISLYNNEKYININAIQNGQSTENIRKAMSKYVTEYNFTDTVLTNNNKLFNCNIIKQHDVSDSFGGTRISTKEINYDTNVLWMDPYNMYRLLAEYDLINKNKYKCTTDSISSLLTALKSNGAVRQFFCAFINTEHVIKYLNTICTGWATDISFMRAVAIHEWDSKLQADISKTYCMTQVSDPLYIKENKDAEKYIVDYYMYNISAWPFDCNYTVKNNNSSTRRYENITGSIGGPIYNLYVCDKAIIIDASGCFRTRYKYIRFYKYISDKIKETVHKKYPTVIDYTIDNEIIPDALKKITPANFKNCIKESDTDYLYDITVEFKIASVPGTESTEVCEIKDVFLVYKKDFIRVDENIIETVCDITGTSTTQKEYTDIYFSTPILDDEFDSIMSEAKKKYSVMSNKQYYTELNEYSAVYNKTDCNTGDRFYNVVNLDYEDVLYTTESANLKPLYNSVSSEDKKTTVVYNNFYTHNIKECAAYYSGLYPAQGTDRSSVKNYRYGTSDMSKLVAVNSTLLNSLINIYKDHYINEENIYNYNYNDPEASQKTEEGKEKLKRSIYNNYIKYIADNITTYVKYHGSGSNVSLLKPNPGGELDALGLADSNIFSYTANGENYGFYIIGVLFDNTKVTFNLDYISSITAEKTGDTDEKTINYSVKSGNANVKTFCSFNNVPLINYDTVSSTISISIPGMQYCISSFQQLVPFINFDIVKTIYSISTLDIPDRMNLNVQYFQHAILDNDIPAGATEQTISYKKKSDVMSAIETTQTFKHHILSRYWTYALPSFTKLSDMQLDGIFNYIYNTKRKDTDSILIKTGKYASVGDCVIDPNPVTDINEYPGINIYSKPDQGSFIDSFNNITESNYKEPEYKHFNVSTFYCLIPEFIISMPGTYVYNDVLKMSAEEEKKRIFKSYINNYNKRRYLVTDIYDGTEITDDTILFLYSRYRCETHSSSAGIKAGERAYRFWYRFILK